MKVCDLCCEDCEDIICAFQPRLAALKIELEAGRKLYEQVREDLANAYRTITQLRGQIADLERSKVNG